MTGSVRPLDGIRILAVEHMLAGPFGTMLLADLGAEVIKVEPPTTGELARGIGPFFDAPDGSRVAGTYLRANRNKQSITLNLKHPRGRALFVDLAGRSDAVAENMRAGVMERLGLGYPDLARQHPRLVYLSISGYGHQTLFQSPYSDWPAYAPLAEAWAGLTDLVRGSDGAPVGWLGFALGDIYTSLIGMIGLLSAIRHRDLTGQGQYIDIAMYDCMLSLNELAILLYSLQGQIAERHDGRSAPVDAYRCQDGYIMIACVKNDDWVRLAQVIGRPDLLEAEDLKTPAGRTVLRESVLRPAIEDWTVARGKVEAATILAQANVPAAPVQNAADLQNDPHVTARRMLVDVPHPAGSVRMAANPIKLSAVPEEYRPAPKLGEQTDIILGTLLDLGAEEIAALRAAGTI